MARIDPYVNFKFRLKWNGVYVAGVSKVTALQRTTPVSAGQTRFEPITLERGVTHDADVEQWALHVWDYADGPDMGWSRASLRRDFILELYDEAGQLALSYTLYRCWPSEFDAPPEFDASGNAVAIRKLVLQNEGWAIN